MSQSSTTARFTVRRTAAPQGVAADPLSKLRSALDALGMKEKKGPQAFAEFERELHARLMEIERDVVGAELAKLDVDADAVVIDGKVHRRVLRQSQTYRTTAGEVVVERTLYKDRGDHEGRCVSPMELTAGVVADFWTPLAAQQALWVVTQMTPGKAVDLFERLGTMGPSKSSLDRLPKRISEQWEGHREKFEAALREGLQIPEGTVSVAVSTDGVLAPMEGTEAVERQIEAERQGSVTYGAAGLPGSGLRNVVVL